MTDFRGLLRDRQLSGALFVAATAVCVLLGIASTGGNDSPLFPLIALPVILAVVRCDFEVVVGVGVILASGYVFLSSRAPSIGPTYSGQAVVRAVTFVIMTLIGAAYAQQVQRERARLIHTVEEQEALLEVSQGINASESLESALHGTLTLLGTIFPDIRSAVIYLLNDEKTELLPACAAGQVELNSLKPIRLVEERAEWRPDAPAHLVIPDTSQRADSLFAGIDPGARSVILTGLRSLRVPIGALALTTDRPHAFPSARARLIQDFADRIGYPLQKLRVQESLQGLANTDPMTGLFNIRIFRQRLQEELRRAGRYQHPLSVVIVDLDDFKQVNDRWGHPAGDAVLIGVANVLRGMIRETDVAARYGGEEFIVLCPETGTQAAGVVAERIRASVASLHVEIASGQFLRVTCSIGHATFPDDATLDAELIACADEALYHAKRTGKNRTVSSASNARTQGKA